MTASVGASMGRLGIRIAIWYLTRSFLESGNDAAQAPCHPGRLQITTHQMLRAQTTC